jgi:L-asparagine oxygenase
MFKVTVKDSKKWKDDLIGLSNHVQKHGLSKETIMNSALVAEKYIPTLEEISVNIKSKDGCSLLKGCPVDEKLNELPYHNMRLKKSWISELVVLGVTQALKFNPYGFQQEKDGALIHEVIPIKGKEDEASSNGITEFKLHNDGAYLSRDVRPETLTLLCLNNDANTDTKLVRLQSIIEGLKSTTVDILSSNNFVHAPPTTFEVNQNMSSRSSILDKIDGMWESKIATHNCQTQLPNSKIKKAIDEFIGVAELKAFSHAWRVGDLLIFNNLRYLHGRGEISGKRWLQRCYGSSRISCAAAVNLVN